MSETNLMKKMMVRLSQNKAIRVFRVNVGKAWTGSDFFKRPNGDLLIKNPRPFKTGVPNGFSDLFGIVTVKITKEMVGRTVGIFTAIEVKTPKGKASKEQISFIGLVKKLGGRAGIARSEQQAEDIANGNSRN